MALFTEGRLFPVDTIVPSTNKNDLHDITNHMRRVGIPLTGLTPLHVLPLSGQDLDFQHRILRFIICWIVWGDCSYVDIGRIVDHHCLNNFLRKRNLIFFHELLAIVLLKSKSEYVVVCKRLTRNNISYMGVYFSSELNVCDGNKTYRVIVINDMLTRKLYSKDNK